MRGVKHVDLNRFHMQTEPVQSAKHSEKDAESSTRQSYTNIETGGLDQEDEKPCRIAIHISGLEWFLYNRSPAYEAILKATNASKPKEKPAEDSPHATGNDALRHSDSGPTHRPKRLSKQSRKSENTDGSVTGRNSLSSNGGNSSGPGKKIIPASDNVSMIPHEDHRNSQAGSPSFLSLLPIWVQCNRGAIILGNENTKVLLSTTFDKAEGKLDASSAGPLDIYRQMFKFDFSHPIIQMKPNPDFKSSQTQTAEMLGEEHKHTGVKSRHRLPRWHVQRRGRHVVRSLRDLIPYFRRSIESFVTSSSSAQYDDINMNDNSINSEGDRWFGLTRYMDEATQDDHEVWSHIEYARFSTLVDCPSIGVNFYWDVPGPVRMQHHSSSDDSEMSSVSHIVNGAEQPMYGMDITVKGGTINYGPWADRARAEIQNVFFPNAFQNVAPAEPLKVGENRLSTTFVMRIEIETETTIRIATRESSKDWQWRRRAEAVRGAARLKRSKNKRHVRKKNSKSGVGPDIRPFGWLALSIDPDSSVSFEMDMLPGKTEYSTNVLVDLVGTRMTSSVNHGLLWRCGPQRLRCDLPNPLAWNDLREWTFSIHSQSLEFFILRDHMFLLTDLINDWSSGPPPEYLTFVPFKYNVNLDFSNLKLYLNTNDANIIDDPSDPADNNFLILGGRSLTSNLQIPLDKFRPSQNSIKFNAELKNASLDLTCPSWNTFYTFLDGRSQATLKQLTLDGSYNYYLATSPALTDSLILNLKGSAPKIYLYGFLIRQFMKVKDNYFGDDLHFRTLAEFQENIAAKEPLTAHDIQSQKKDNDLDVMLTVQADQGGVILPGNLYARRENIQLDVLQVEADLRFTNYYMDMDARFSPIEASVETIAPGPDGDLNFSTSNVQLFVDGIEIYGHRLFGLPPTEPTYVCNWDFHVGNILGECSTAFLHTLIASIRALTFSLDDDENALPETQPTTIHDVTFLRAYIGSVRVWVLIGDAALLLSAGASQITLQDWADNLFSGRVTLSVPDIVIATVDRSLANARRERGLTTVPASGALATSLQLKLLNRSTDFEKNRDLQSQHIRLHDQRTQRVPWMTGSNAAIPMANTKHAPPAMSSPSMPSPVGQLGRPETGTTKLRKSSFISTESLRRGRGSKGNGNGFSRLPKSTVISRINQRNVEHDSQTQITRDVPEAVTVSYSSPWSPPYFSLAHLEPDLAELPEITDIKQRHIVDTPDDFVFDNDEDISRRSVLCTFDQAVVCFLTPAVFQTVSLLLEDLAPKHPADLLDMLQIDCVSQLIADKKLSSQLKSTLDVRIVLPYMQIRAINSHQVARNGLEQTEQDIYTGIVSNLDCNLRLINKRPTVPGTTIFKRSWMAYIASEELAVIVSGKHFDSQYDETALQTSIQDTAFWTIADDTTVANVQVRTVNLETWSRTVDLLTSLIQRTIFVVEDIAAVLEGSAHKPKDSLRSLTYSLTMNGNNLPDPPFLTRPSYVLRTATDHLRTNDTWKIVSRLHYMYESLPDTVKEKMVADIANGVAQYPADAQEHVIASLDQWRAWELAQVDRSLVMEQIWGLTSPTSEMTSSDIRCTVSVGGTRLLLDPGPRQNEIAFGDLETVLSMRQKADDHEPDVVRQNIGLRAYCDKSSIRLNWEICGLLEDTLTMLNDGQTVRTQPSTTKPNTNRHIRIIQDAQIVVGTDLGIVTLDSVNLKVTLLAKSLRGSLMHLSPGLEQTSPNTSLLLGAASASADILNEDRVLLSWRLRAPNVHCSFSPIVATTAPTDLKIVANCQKIHFSTKADITRLTEVVGRIVEDEVQFFISVSKMLKQRNNQADQVKEKQRTSDVCLSVALFLDNYHLSILFLPTLSYVIVGDIARSSVTTERNGELTIDFDLQKHSHSFHSKRTKSRTAFSTLKLPPINGRVNVARQAQASVVMIDLTIEKVKLDGGALSALIDAGGRPELSRALKESRLSVERIQSHVGSMFTSQGSNTAEERTAVSTERPFIYIAKVTLAGLSVLTSAPTTSAELGSSADLEFELSLIRLKLHNKRDDRVAAFTKPQFDIDLRQISLELRQRQEKQVVQQFGSLKLAAVASGHTELDDGEHELQNYRLASGGLDIVLFPETATLITRIAYHMQERIKGLDLSHDYRPVEKLRRLTRPELFDRSEKQLPEPEESDTVPSAALLDSTFSIELAAIQASWVVPDDTLLSPGRRQEDLVFSIRKIDLSTKRENSARLAIDDLRLQMVPKMTDKSQRSMNSALLPEIVFNVAYYASREDWRLAFQAAGKALDLRLTSDFILPASSLQASFAATSHVLRNAEVFTSSSAHRGDSKPHLFGKKRLSSLLIDADFAGAVVAVQERPLEERKSAFSLIKGSRRTKATRYEQFVQGEPTGRAMLRAPGVAFKVEFKDNGTSDPSLRAEVKVAGSKNVLEPTVVPLILEIYASIKEAVGDSQETGNSTKLEATKAISEGTMTNGDPSAILGKTTLNLGLWVEEQEFSLTCQPIARVAATARFDDIFIAMNTVQSEQTRFFSMLVSLNALAASVQHVYSRESTASFDVQSINVSLMNSKHISSANGLSAIVNVSPMKMMVNAKQVQDFLLFREIWYPPEVRKSTRTPATSAHADSQAFAVQRYQQVAATSAFPLNAILAIADLAVEIDLGQGLGKMTLSISKLWTSSKKSSDLEQNLCLGFDRISIDTTGRMSGFIQLQNFQLRTSIKWPSKQELRATPLIQASARFDGLRVKAVFDYQPFFIADVTAFEFMMFNVREQDGANDRLVGILEGDKVQVYCTTASASLGLALYQAILRLVQEKQAAYESSIRELDKFLRRRSVFPSAAWSITGASTGDPSAALDEEKMPHSLHTDVVVTLKAVNIGAFPGSFFDSQIFKIEASNSEARFGVAIKHGRTHSGLGLTLGQLRVALSGVNRSTTKAFGEVSVGDVVKTATGSRGGTILKVPKVVAQMETWQSTSSNHIDFIFKSKFEGKVDVGWNYSRISFIRSMWSTHAQALASRLGKPLPQSAVQITGGLPPKSDSSDPSSTDHHPENGQEKITAVVNVPQSRFEYTALEPPIIETPQLRDMGEATPPLEWIGLHRDRLPNLTHQIIIVTLLEVAKEVEDAYRRILGAT